MFAVEKGFTWRQVCTVVTFCDGILKDSKGIITVVTPYLPASTHMSFVYLCGGNHCVNFFFWFHGSWLLVADKDITDALQFLKLQSFELADVLGQRNFPIYTDFAFQTYLRHFKLFKYVFTQERDILKPTVSLRVETPADPGSMKQSKPELVWEYEKQYESIQREEAEHANKRLEEKAKTLETAEKQAKERLEKISRVQEPLSKEVSVQSSDVDSMYKNWLGIRSNKSTSTWNNTSKINQTAHVEVK